MTVAKKYELGVRTQLRDWIKRHNTHEDFKSESSGSKVSQMKKISLEYSRVYCRSAELEIGIGCSLIQVYYWTNS